MTTNINRTSIFAYISRLMVMPALFLLFALPAQANKGANAATPLVNVLNLYYDVKDALVNSDAAAASKKATALLNAVKGVDAAQLTADERKAFSPLQEKISFDARHISEVQDIAHQREHFAALSLNMYALAKGVKISSTPVYEEYCPMKKSYWLSKEKDIKNPYYGSQMLTCGKVANTIE